MSASALVHRSSARRWMSTGPNMFHRGVQHLMRRSPHESPTFKLEVVKSHIVSAGLGVQVQRAANAETLTRNLAVSKGTVVALYAGIYYPLPPRRVMAMNNSVVDIMHLIELNGGEALHKNLQDASFQDMKAYWLVCEEHGVIDGFRAASRLAPRASMNPYAVGQMINHPEVGAEANVYFKPFVWHDVCQMLGAYSPESVNQLHQGLWYVDPNLREPVMMPKLGSSSAPPLIGGAIVALRDLYCNEELLMDYRFAPPYPAWYTPIISGLQSQPN